MSTEEKWDEYLELVRRYLATGRFDRDEIDYKIEIARKLERARVALLAGDDEWLDLLRQGLSGKAHPMDWRDADHLRKWLNRDRKAGREALRTVWSDGDLKPGAIRAFSERFPADAGPGGAGTRLRTISALLMALGPDRYPPYAARAYGQSFRRLSYSGPPKGADEETIYGHALAFLDELVSRAKKRGLERPANRLEAQSIVWVMRSWPKDAGNHRVKPAEPATSADSVAGDLASLARELYLPVDFLETAKTLLDEKKQVIFQGPPGTGKTYVAHRLARHLAGASERCRLVQLHPSYTYEDFVRGYRPRLTDNGQPGFALEDGPFMQIARQAERDRGVPYFLIIDEINRGNLAKVFGELYFLLEYRETPNRLNEHYRGVVTLARLVLRHGAFEAGRGKVRASGFLMDMSQVFQEFVTVALRECLELSEHCFRADERLVGEYRVHLDEAGRVGLRPDFSWWDGRVCTFAGDAKYKRATDDRTPNADLYQMLAYATALDLPGGLLVYAAGDADSGPSELDHRIRHAGKHFHVVTLDLAGPIARLNGQLRVLAAKVRGLREETFAHRRRA